MDRPSNPSVLRSKPDWLLATAVLLITIVFVALHVPHPTTPMEDASMLLRYSQNLARGYGIVWNPGEHPVEGATDFLFMVLIGGLARLFHASVKTIAATILFVSHVASVGVLYFALRRFYAATRLLAAGLALALGVGIGYHYIVTGFSAPFYALFALLTWIAGLSLIERGVTLPRALLFSALAFTTGLIRPDGVLLACFILASVLYGQRDKRLALFLTFTALFAVCGGAYFAWRLHYFGYPLPNPFYIKRTGGLNLANFKSALRTVVEMLLTLLPLAGFALRNSATRKRLSIWLITVIPFIAAWMLVSLDNNHFARFQYVLVPLSILELGGFAAAWWYDLSTRHPAESAAIRYPVATVMIFLVAATLYSNIHLYRLPFSNRGGQELAERLKPYAGKGYTLLTTEAGDIPFYSEWRTVDLIGLNDEYIAHHGGLVTEAYLEQNSPEIILYRDKPWEMHQADLSATEHKGVPTMGDKLTWDARLTRDFAVTHGYIHAASWGAKYCDYHTYWVKPNTPDTDALVSAIRDHPYYSQADGELSYDFRDAPIPTQPCSINRY